MKNFLHLVTKNYVISAFSNFDNIPSEKNISDDENVKSSLV